MVSLWRAGLDVKARAIRTVQDPLSQLEMANIFMDTKNLVRDGWDIPERTITLGQAIELGRSHTNAAARLIMNSEPIVVDMDVMNRLVSQYNGQHGEESRVPTYRKLPPVSELPLQHGLVVFEHPVMIGTVSQEEMKFILEDDVPGLPDGVNFVGLAGIFYSVGATNKAESPSPALVMRGFLEPKLVSWSNPRFPRGGYVSHIPRPWFWNLTAGAYDALEHVIPTDEHDMHFVTRWMVCFMLTLWDYMGQRVDSVSHPQPDRQQMSYARKLNLSPKIQVVHWRKEQAAPTVPGTEPVEVAWQCRWTVRPHTRTLRSGKIVPVRAHTKGPKDAPMKAANTRINVVDR